MFIRVYPWASASLRDKSPSASGIENGLAKESPCITTFAMEEIKAATARLDPDEQFELFCWWVDSDTFKQRQLAALNRDIALGLDQLGRGAYQACTEARLRYLCYLLST